MALFREMPQDHELMQLLRQRRSAPDPTTVAYLERLQAAVAGGSPPPQAARPSVADLARTRDPNATDEEIARLQDYWTTVESFIRPPTAYEDIGHHTAIQIKAIQLDEAVTKFRRWRTFDRPPLFALMDLGQVNARTTLAPNGDDHIVLIDNELMTFLLLFSKAVALAMPMRREPTGWFSFGYDITAVRDHLRRDSRARVRFTDAVLNYVVTGRASHAEPYQIANEALPLSIQILEATEIFVMAHEYVHILEKHLSDGLPDISRVDGDNVIQSLGSLTKEVAADRFALNLTDEVFRIQGNRIPFFAYWAAELFLYLKELLLKAISLLRSGHETAGLHGGQKHEHASLDGRRFILKALLQEELKKGAANEAHFQNAWSQMVFLPGVVAELWDGVVSILRTGHAEGIRPAPEWDEAAS